MTYDPRSKPIRSEDAADSSFRRALHPILIFLLFAAAAAVLFFAAKDCRAQAAPRNLGELLGAGQPTCWNVSVLDSCPGGKCGHGIFNPAAHLITGSAAEIDARYGAGSSKAAGDCNGGEAMGALDSLCLLFGWPFPCETVENFNDAHYVATAPVKIAAALAAGRGAGGGVCPAGQSCQPPPQPFCLAGQACQPFPPPKCPPTPPPPSTRCQAALAALRCVDDGTAPLPVILLPAPGIAYYRPGALSTGKLGTAVTPEEHAAWAAILADLPPCPDWPETACP